MKPEKPRKTTSGCTHQKSVLEVCANFERTNGTSTWAIAVLLTFRVLLGGKKGSRG
jgi:hypothetical protein